MSNLEENNAPGDESMQSCKCCTCCLSDSSWTCIFLGVIIFGVIAGAIAALIVTQTSIIRYYKPMPFLPPNKTFSVDYLWQGYRYDFYQKKETYENARKICEHYNTTLLVFNSTQEEREIDCYLNVRNNAEDTQLIIWLNETIFFGGPLMYARLASFFSENRQEVLYKTNQTITENGCDVQKDYDERKAIWTADQENTKLETTYNIVKIYGNNGLRSKSQGSRNGCWNFVRWNETAHMKHTFICRTYNPIIPTDTTSLDVFKPKVFSELYCS